MNNGIRTGLAAVALAAAGAAFGKASDAGTHGVWLGIGAKAALDTNRVFTASVNADSRFGEKHLEEQHGFVSLVARPVGWLAVAPHYHFLDVRRRGGGKHHWEREHRGGVDVTPAWTLGGWRFSDRNRVVYRDFENAQGFWRYRNRLEVAAPWTWTEWRINPYASWELFLDDGKPAKHVRKNDKFDQWRFITGVTAKVADGLSLNLYYLLQEKKDTTHHDWSPNHVIGLSLSYSF